MAEEENLTTRVDKLEQLAVLLTQSQIATNEDFQKTEAQFRETDRRIAESRLECESRGKALDERIDKLVSAIGELISRIPPAALSPEERR
jgi:predicted  nucleic acid-binding Zn-ribbon protein